MKSFRMVRPGGHVYLIVELSIGDLLKLLLGRELYLKDQVLHGEKIVMHYPFAHSVLNLAAPRVDV